MNEQEICPQESKVLHARREGHWTEDIAQHIAVCSSCRETDRVASWMGRLATVPTEKPLPEADVLWMMAQTLKPERLRLDRRFLESVAALAIGSLLVVLAWPVIQSIVSSLVPASAMFLVPLLVPCVAAAGLGMVAVKSGIFREE
jgi:predicted anti-sigma-YlaC factor YlaD